MLALSVPTWLAFMWTLLAIAVVLEVKCMPCSKSCQVCSLMLDCCSGAALVLHECTQKCILQYRATYIDGCMGISSRLRSADRVLLLLLLPCSDACRMVFMGGLAALQHSCFEPNEIGDTTNSVFSELLLQDSKRLQTAAYIHVCRHTHSIWHEHCVHESCMMEVHV
ncbi:hypothetical protein COO60DRAFT_1497747, partial [Scenedesmus sp. NREL 46B-D3]